MAQFKSLLITGPARVVGKFYASGGLSGNGSDITNINATNIKTGTLAKERLASSGVTAGSYGPTANATAAHNGKIKIPQVTVDTYGRVTSVVDREITLPPPEGSVSGNAGTATKLQTARKIKLTGAVTGETSFDGSADASIAATLSGFDASKITSGTIDVARLPPTALEKLKLVADDTARFALTTATVQNGDTVYVESTGKMYYVIDQTKLNSEAGYKVYTAGTAGACSGNSATATKLATARKINGVNFDGTADIIVVDNTKLPLTGGTLTGETKIEKASGDTFFKTKRTDTDRELDFGIGYSGDNAGIYDKNLNKWILLIQSNGNTLLTGRSTTTDKLATARKINGVAFDGSKDITVTSDPTQNILTNENLDNIKTTGFFNGPGGNTVSSKPSGIDAFGMIVYRTAGGYFVQELSAGNGPLALKKYMRQYQQGDSRMGWTSWVELKFTDTTYAAATTSQNGLMSAADKSKVVNTNIAYGTCTTAAATAAKVVNITGNPNWVLGIGSRITVKFTQTNTAKNPTLNVNGTGAKAIIYGSNVTITTSYLDKAGYGNRYIEYMYDGTNWIFMGWSSDDNNTYNPQTLGFGYGTCSTAEETLAKTVPITGYSLQTNGTVSIKFSNNVPANSTLNINNKGAKNIFYNGAKITNGIIKAGDTATFRYDGTQYQLISVDTVYEEMTSAELQAIFTEIGW